MARRSNAHHGDIDEVQFEGSQQVAGQDNNNGVMESNQKIHTSNSGFLSVTKMAGKSFADQWTVKKKKNFRRTLFLLLLFLGGLLFVQYACRPIIGKLLYGRKSRSEDHLLEGACVARDKVHYLLRKKCTYDNRYPATEPKYDDAMSYRIAVISDLDEELSKVPGKANLWRSYYKEGYLTHNKKGEFSVQWDEKQVQVTSTIAEKGRGLELSEIVYFNGKLLSVDDRTGIVYQIRNGKVLPWVLLTDGDGTVAKGFKGEWMTIKDRTLYVGGLGKEWTTTTGEVLNFNPQFIKTIGPQGEVKHHDWRPVYLQIRKMLGISPPGYVIHEAVCWSPVKRRWYFLPRRASHEKYDDQVDERKGTNYLITCDEDFQDFQVRKVGKLILTRGYSSFKFIPGFNDEVIVALKSEEVKGKINSYITVFNIHGDVLMDDERIGGEKYEGIEFI